MNPFQRKAAEVYAGGEFAHVTDPEERVGDTLFTFVMRELADATTLAEAIRMLETAERDIREVREALEDAADEEILREAIERGPTTDAIPLEDLK